MTMVVLVFFISLSSSLRLSKAFSRLDKEEIACSFSTEHLFFLYWCHDCNAFIIRGKQLIITESYGGFNHLFFKNIFFMFLWIKWNRECCWHSTYVYFYYICSAPNTGILIPALSPKWKTIYQLNQFLR